MSSSTEVDREPAEPADRNGKPTGARTVHSLESTDRRLPYSATADWLSLRKEDEPIANVFYVYYRLEEENEASNRPITFLFNGGPGAASAFLHVGTAGPRRIVFNPDGTPPPAPVTLTDNADSWLLFSDLVFVDPVGTGFSRAIPERKSGDEKVGADDGSKRAHEFWKIQRDLDALCEFVSTFLSRHHRWDSPTFIAGESYGGFRGAKLARQLQEQYGVGLNGVILISPALDFSTLSRSDYDLLHWIDLFPTLAAAAFVHGRSTAPDGATVETVLDAAQHVSITDLPRLLIAGDTLDKRDRDRIVRRVSATLGLDRAVVARVQGRVSADLFARELLRDRGLVCGLYDASVTVRDPFPARPGYEGPDPTLRSVERVFASGINVLIRRELQVDTEREYHLLNMEVNRNWKDDAEQWSIANQIQAVDDLRYAMTLNPYMRVRISHGIYDMVTPFRTSDRVVAHMDLDDATHERLTLKHYPGGHMFYTWDTSRKEFTSDIRRFYLDSLQRPGQ